VLSAVLALGGCAAASLPSPSATGPAADRPQYQLGAQWIRTDGIYELVRIEGDRYIFSSSQGGETHLTRNLGLAEIAGIRRVTGSWELDPPFQLSWPLQVGKTGKQAGVFRTSTVPGDWRAQTEWTVAALEDVTVPAGTFKAYRIAVTLRAEHGSSSGGGGFGARATQRQIVDFVSRFNLWYAPSVERFVKSDGPTSRTFELAAVEAPTTGPVQIAIERLSDNARLDREEITLSATATAAKGLSSLRVTHDGAEVLNQDLRRDPKNQVTLSLPVRLRPGKNVLLVTATDVMGQARQEARTVHYEPAARQAAAEALRAQAMAARVDAARADAERLAPDSWLVATAKETEADKLLSGRADRSELSWMLWATSSLVARSRAA
jgi:hypothetical protein